MHEFSIAMNIVEIIKEAALDAQANIIAKIELEIGTLAGVEEEALNTALNICLKDTVAENAEIIIDNIKGFAKCKECSENFATDDLFTICPECNSFNIEIVRGKELKVKAIHAE